MDQELYSGHNLEFVFLFYCSVETPFREEMVSHDVINELDFGRILLLWT